MEEIKKREKKSFFKIFIVFIGLALAIDLTMYLLKSYTSKLPYLSTILSVVLVTLACGYILLKYFTSYSYYIAYDHLVFSRIIGKRKFEILTLRKDQLVGLEKTEGKKATYDFRLGSGQSYRGVYTSENKDYSFYFNPSPEFLKKVKSYINGK